jgi:hypothetical protein
MSISINNKSLSFELSADHDADDAGDQLVDMIMYKINYHNKKVFSDKIRLGVRNEESIKRIDELKIDLDNVRELIKQAKISNSKINIHSVNTITIQ